MRHATQRINAVDLRRCARVHMRVCVRIPRAAIRSGLILLVAIPESLHFGGLCGRL